MTTKRFNNLSEHVATNVARWSGGTLSPWEGYAALTPQELADLLALAAYAPGREIDRYIAGVKLADINTED